LEGGLAITSAKQPEGKKAKPHLRGIYFRSREANCQAEGSLLRRSENVPAEGKGSRPWVHGKGIYAGERRSGRYTRKKRLFSHTRQKAASQKTALEDPRPTSMGKRLLS